MLKTLSKASFLGQKIEYDKLINDPLRGKLHIKADFFFYFYLTPYSSFM